ncbi:MAG: General stress protein 13 [Firmicutes bacterium ADurb.Bin193]|nr:MAG: General stress protein 13 [Firmicutes bacterium ADurb.Bin193]
MEVEVGKIIEGRVTGITNFGAFVQLPDGKTGLVHISEIDLAYVKDINDHLKANDVVKVKVISVDDKGKVSLSIKQAMEQEHRENSKKPVQVSFGTQPAEGAATSFEEKMRLFMQYSDEKMTDLRRNLDSKRGGGGRRSPYAHL